MQEPYAALSTLWKDAKERRDEARLTELAYWTVRHI